METLQTILEKANALGTSYSRADQREYEQIKVDALNACEGTEHEKDGYHCSLCKNKGYIAKLEELPNGMFTYATEECKCAEIRRSILRLKKSGLKDIIRDYTFDKYEADEPWQQMIKEAAEEYARNPKGWFFLGGQSGSGKTHLCTAICREFLLSGRQVVYMLWRDDIERMKGYAMEAPEQRAKMIDRFKKAEILYIDDLFKTGQTPDGKAGGPSRADIHAAFEIINHRYNNPASLTILSSELSERELLDIDEAICGRIFERAKTFSIAKNRERNYRLRKTVTV